MAASKAYRKKRLERGLCRECPAPIWKHAMCRECYEKALQYSREYRARNLGDPNSQKRPGKRVEQRPTMQQCLGSKQRIRWLISWSSKMLTGVYPLGSNDRPYIPLRGDVSRHPGIENKRRKEEVKMSTSNRKKPEVGDIVVYHNERGVGHNALVTAVWGPYMINLTYVSSNDTQKDDYGRQIVRESSVPMTGYPFGQPNAEGSCVHGRYARYPSEEAVPYAPPQAV